MADKIEPQPEQKMTISSYLRKKNKASKKDITPEAIKEKYSEPKPMSFKEYAEKIKERHTPPAEPTIDSKVSDIKEKFYEEERYRAEQPAKTNTNLTKNEQEA